MAVKPLFMETTQIAPERTAAEVHGELVKAGASQINTSYTGGKVSGLRWVMSVNGMDALFEMPARVEPIYVLLMKRRGYNTPRNSRGEPYSPETLLKAERVAWRQLLRWVQAQNAMIETGMVQPMEVFQAYFIPPGQDRTMFQLMMEKQFKALPEPEAVAV